MPNKLTIEELLVKHHYLTQNQLDRAMHFRGQDMDQSVEELLMDLGYVTEEAVIQCAALRDHVPVVNLDDIRIDLKAADMVSPAFAERNRIIPIDFDGDRLVVAAAYPMDQDILDETATITGMEVKAMLVTSCAMEKAIEKTYGSSRERFGGSGEAMDISSLDRQNELLFMERVESAPVVRMVNAIIENAYSRNASDIHVEPGKHDLVIRMRINGDLIVHTTLEMEYHRPMVTRLKLMAGMDIAEKRLPQDGKYHYEKASVSTDLRISTLPTIFGEKVVLRLLGNDRDNSLMDINLHTNDCASTINRLRNMGVPPYMAAAALSGIVSQRLVKLLCPECRKPYAPDEREKRLFGEMGLKEPESLFRAVGCPCCSGTGYIRRKAVYELMEVDEEVKSMILDDALPRDIRLYQRKRGLKSIKEYVLQMVLEGETSMEEAEKIIYSAE